MLSSKRDRTSAATFLCKAIGDNGIPRIINIDQSAANEAAIALNNQVTGSKIRTRKCKYLNNIVEGDHFGLKKCLTSATGFKRFNSAEITIYGAEVVRMIRKQQLEIKGSLRLSQIEMFKSLAG